MRRPGTAQYAAACDAFLASAVGRADGAALAPLLAAAAAIDDFPCADATVVFGMPSARRGACHCDYPDRAYTFWFEGRTFCVRRVSL